MEVLRIKTLKYDRYFRCPDNYPRGYMPSGRLSPGQLPPKWLLPPDNCPRTIAPERKCPRWKFLPGQLPPGQLPSRKIDPRAIVPEENYSPENCPLIKKFPSKIIAPTQANPPQRVLCVNWSKLYIAYEYYNIRVMQLRCKNRFTSIHFFTNFN